MTVEQDDLALAHALLAEGKKPEAFNHLVKARAAAGRDLARLDAIARGMEQADQIHSAYELRKFIVVADPNDVSAQMENLRIGAIAVRGDASGLKTVENELDALISRLPLDAAGLWLAAGNVYQSIPVTGKALRAVKNAGAGGLDSADVLLQIAHFYVSTGRHWRCWWTLRKLFRLTDLPNYRLAELSLLSRRAACPNLAIRYARRMQAMDPRDVNALLLEAKAFVDKRKLRYAATLIKERLEEFKSVQDDGTLALEASPVLLAGDELEAERSLLLHAAATWPHNEAIATRLQIAQFGTKSSSWQAKAQP